MPAANECCVLIPAATLEDFPRDLSGPDAGSLLAAWTVLWHPRLLAEFEQIPTWYRADIAPEPIGPRIVTVPAPALRELPEGYSQRALQTEGCHWIVGENRHQMLAELAGFPGSPVHGHDAELIAGDRRVGPADFYAAGFAALQIQIMTRRLRYTSNLDELHLQGRITAAAKAYVAGDGEATVDALHDVFDCLAEERDHYFSSDPHLIDLTLVTASTVDRLLQTGLGLPKTDDSKRSSAALATPVNLLLDNEAAVQIAADPSAEHLRVALASRTVGWASGGPPADQHLDTMTFTQSQDAFRAAYQSVGNAIGAAPGVYGRLSGSTPSDMTSSIAGLGYDGMIPIDFAAGTGFGTEAKVLLQSGAVEIEALTAKPLDAASDASFLTIAANLGEAIDSGEVATALLVHWPGQGCDSYHDLRRVASWCLALGRFWRIDEYFRDGEHPYHHGNTTAMSPDAASILTTIVDRKTADPISSWAAEFRRSAVKERDALLVGMCQLVSGRRVAHECLDRAFAEAIGVHADDSGGSVLVINPHSVGCRDHVTLAGTPAPAKHLFATSRDERGTAVTVDIPACGFVTLRPGRASGSDPGSVRKWLRNKWLGISTSIAESGRLQNEFLEATISPDSGGISGVYSGQARGNRLSMRLIAVGFGQETNQQDSVMRCHHVQVVESSMAVGCIEARGEIIGSKQSSLAEFSIRYTLRRGSRWIEVDGNVTPKVAIGDDPWRSYVATRVAVASDAAITRPMLRDKIHRSSGRRLVAPLGLVIDESERQTMIASGGLAFHRRVSERFFDTLLSVQGETKHSFSIRYGFDVPNPVATAKSLLAPPIRVSVNAETSASTIGWIIHSAPKDVIVTDLRVERREDGRLAALVRVIQTRSMSCKATLHFCRDVKFACIVSGSEHDVWNRPLPESEDCEGLPCQGDRVSIPLASHGVGELFVIFV